LSYVPNAAIMPRKRGPADGPNVVSLAAVEQSADTIAFAEFTDFETCISETSTGQTNNELRNKSHRPTHALMTAGGGQYNGQSPADMNVTLYALTKAAAEGPLGWGGPSDSSSVSNASGCRRTLTSGGHHIKWMEPRATAAARTMFLPTATPSFTSSSRPSTPTTSCGASAGTLAPDSHPGPEQSAGPLTVNKASRLGDSLLSPPS
jgi:hypothetical protein